MRGSRVEVTADQADEAEVPSGQRLPTSGGIGTEHPASSQRPRQDRVERRAVPAPTNAKSTQPTVDIARSALPSAAAASTRARHCAQR
jgi:hypothetical protein